MAKAPTLEERQAKARHDIERFDWVARQPGLSSGTAAAARQLVRVARASLELSRKAIEHRDNPPPLSPRDAALHVLLRVPPPEHW
jgi:hypothetical protein